MTNNNPKDKKDFKTFRKPSERTFRSRPSSTTSKEGSSTSERKESSFSKSRSNFSDRKFSDKPRTERTDRPKFSSDRPKFERSDRPKFSSDRPKFERSDRPSYSRFSDKPRFPRYEKKSEGDKDLSLSNLSNTENSKEERTRKGRGTAAGRGKFAGYGKLTSRKTKPGFEGGQTPWFRRIPKRGFTNIHQERYDLINLDDLSAIVELPDLITHEYLVEAGIIKNKLGQLKILANGEITKAVKVKTHAISRVAEEKIIEAGGSVEIIKSDITINEKSAKHGRVFKNKPFDREKLDSKFNVTEYKKRPRPNFDKKRSFSSKKSFK